MVFTEIELDDFKTAIFAGLLLSLLLLFSFYGSNIVQAVQNNAIGIVESFTAFWVFFASVTYVKLKYVGSVLDEEDAKIVAFVAAGLAFMIVLPSLDFIRIVAAVFFAVYLVYIFLS